MDTVLSKIKSKVSTVLPGNPLTREYEISKQLGCAGPGMAWKLFAAKKRSTHQEATVWEFEKKQLESCPKNQRDMFVEFLKRGISTLVRIKHPKVLSVLQPLEESRESLAFASEPLLTCLKSALTVDRSHRDKAELFSLDLTEVEIKYGLMQLSEALYFLHADCHRIHLNISPEAVVINKFGLWKLSGFEFSKAVELAGMNASLEFSVNLPIWQSSLTPYCQPSLSTSSPEAVLQGQATPASDMFSLGLLICRLFNRGQPMLFSENDQSSYKRSVNNVASLVQAKLSNMPENLTEYVKMMLSVDPTIRPTALQFSRTPYFDDASMSVLRSIDNMYQLDNLARSQLYKSLPSTIHTLPKRLCLFRVFPQIVEDFSNVHMIPFILPAVLHIMDMATQDECAQYILPRLIPVMSLKEPVQIILVLLQNLRVLSEKFPPNEFRLHVLPILHSALDTDNRAVQDLCLNALPGVSSLMELTMLKNAVLPRIQKLFFRTDLLAARVRCLTCIGKLLDNLDKWLVMDEVLPFLQQIRSREPTILMVMLGIYRIAFSHEKLGISREKLATQVLPHLIPLSVESGLNLKQYSAFADLIRDMCAQVEREQRAKLEQLHGAAEENSILGIPSGMSNGWTSSNSCADLMDRIVRSYVDPSAGIFDSSIQEKSDSNATAQSKSLFDHVGESDGKSGTLTMQQKRQLATERLQQERLESHCNWDIIAQPTKKDHAPTKPAPRDLTSTLIESNLANLANRLNYTSPMSSQPGIPLSLVRAPATPMNYLSMPHYNAAPGVHSSNSIIPPTTQFPCATARWEPPRPSTAVPAIMSTPSSPFGTNASTSSDFAASYAPLSKNDIDDLLS